MNWTGEVDFNAATNRLIRRSQGELIVFVQDYVELPEDALEKLWKTHLDKPAFYTVPVVHYDEDGERTDWRLNRKGAIDWREWEIDCGACPRSALYEIGGFDEKLDEKWGYDNVSVALRAFNKGYEFYNIPDIVCRAWDHNKHEEHEFRHLQDVDFANQILEYTEKEIHTVDYLT